MSRRYRLARLGATLEQLPELSDRLNTLGERFELARGGAMTEDLPAAAREAALVFERFYGEAAEALTIAQDRGFPSTGELLAIETLILRAEQAEAAFERALGGSGSSAPATTRRGTSGGGWAVLLVGAALVGGVLFLARTRD